MSLIGNVDTPASYVADYMQACVGMFGIPAGGFVSDIETFGASNGYDVESLYAAMLNSTIGRSIYAPGISSESFATKLVDKVGGGLLSDADKAAAIDEVQALLDGGLSHAATAMAVVEFVAGLETSDATYGAVAQQFANRIEIANYYTFSSTSPSSSLSSLTAVLSGVSNTTDVSDPADYLDTLTDPGVSTGQTFTLTVNQDSGSKFTGTSSGDSFEAVATQDGTGTLINTLQNVDVLDGAGGTDTLIATLAQASTVAPTLKNIENVNVRFADAGAELNLANATGVTAITVSDSTTAGEIQNIGAIASLAIKNQTQNVNIGQTAGSATTMALNLDTVGTSTASITLDLGVDNASKVTTLNATLNNAYAIIDSTNADVVTALTIAATGTNTLSLVDSGATVKTATITGAGSVDLTATALTAALTSFDASAATGAVKVDIQSSGVAVVKTGSGNDVVDMDTTVTANSTVDLGAGNDAVYTGAKLASFKSIAGGEGTDIINITDGSVWTTTNAKLISGFETLDVSGGTGTYDTSLVTFTKVQIDEAVNGTLAGNVTLSNVADTSTLEVMSKAKTNANFTTTKDITVTLKDATGTTAAGTAESTTVNVSIYDGNKDDAADGNVTIVKHTAAGVESVTVNSVVGTTDGGATGVKDNAYSTTITAGVYDSIETLTLTGTTDIVFTALTNTGNTLTKVNASGSSGDITLNASAITTTVAYTGSSGVDTYTATNGGSIKAGSGNDAITLTAAGAGGKADTIIFTAATDVAYTTKTAATKIDAQTVETITNFITASGAVANNEEADVLDVTTFAFSGYQRGAVNLGAITNALEGGSHLATITDLFADAGGDRGVAFGTNGGATYVYIDVNKDGDFTNGSDIAVKLAGITDFASTSLAF